MITGSFEGVLDVVLQFANALQDVVECPVGVHLLVEKLGLDGIDYALNGTDIEDAVVEELVELPHVVEQKQLIHMHRIASNGELSRPNAQTEQKCNDLFLCLPNRQLTA